MGFTGRCRGFVTAIRGKLAARRLALTAAVGIALGVFSSPAAAQSSANVLLVVNESSPDSIRVGDHYARVRAIPANQIVRLKTTATETIARAEYERSIELPIIQWLSKHLLQDQVLFIVLTKGVPLRVDGTGGLAGTISSVDSELTLLYRKMTGSNVLATGRIDNPYFLRDRPLAQARPFSRADHDIYLVTRLDGFTADDVVKLIDRGAKPSRDGQVVLDQKATVLDAGGDKWLDEAARKLSDLGQSARVQLESTRQIASTAQPVLGYFSWGSNDPANQRRQMGLSFSAGAIGGMFVSTDGRTFREPGTAWKPAPAGSSTGGQSLVGDLIREGITGVSGNVSEPYLDAIVRPQILFPSYFAGFTLAESYYLAMPFLSWQTIVIGDPLCAPFLAAPVAQDRLHKGIDAETSLPALFAERRLRTMATLDLKREAVKLHFKAMSLVAQGRPDADVEAVLVRAADLEPRLTPAHMMLADILTKRGDYDAAIGRFRAVLKTDPNNIAALNNLAYYLADKKNLPAEALVPAEKAYRLSKQAPVVADTLGWVYFKLNNIEAARPLIERAAEVLKTVVDVQIHAATLSAAVNDPVRARSYLDTVLKLDPTAAERADVKAVLARIKG